MLTPVVAMVVGEMGTMSTEFPVASFYQKEAVGLWILMTFEVQIPQSVNGRNDSKFPSMDLFQTGLYL